MRFPKLTRRLSVIALCACFLAAGQGAVLSQEAAKVAEIIITGNQNISDAAIRAVVTNLKPGGDFSAEAMENDRKSIEALGYFSAATARSEDTPAGVKALFDVVEFPQIKEIRIVGNKSISSERLTSLLRSKSGQVYNEQTLNLDINAIQKEYTDQGYVAFVSEEGGIDAQTGVLTLPILESIVESVDIVGNKKTPDYVFLREMKTVSGKPLNRKILNEDIKEIYSLGILDPAAYQRPNIEPGHETGKVIVVVPVTEMKTGQISVGLGYHSRKKLVGRAELTEANFRGHAQKLSLLVEVGQRTGTTTRGGNSYQLSFFEPWLDQKNTSLNVSVFDKLVYRFSSSIPFGGDDDIDDEVYSERRKGGTLGFGRPLSDHTRVSTNLRLEEVEVSLPASLLPGTFLSRISQPGPVRSITLGAVNNTRDYDADPAAGWYKSISFEYGRAEKSAFTGTNLGTATSPNTVWTLSPAGSGSFNKAQFDIRRYISKGGPKTAPDEKRRTLALRLMGGIASGTLLFSEQFFVGGAETLRGYREDRFWGDHMLVLSSEFRMPMGKNLTGVVFADYGDAWGPVEGIEPVFAIDGKTAENFDQHESFDPNVGVGIGIRVVTPIGPLRLDYGIGSDGARTHFSIGHAF